MRRGGVEPPAVRAPALLANLHHRWLWSKEKPLVRRVNPQAG